MRGLNLTDVHDCGIVDIRFSRIFTPKNLLGWCMCLSPWIIGGVVWVVVRR